LPDDTSKVRLLNELGKEFLNKDPDSALVISAIAEHLAITIHDDIGLAKAHRNAGVAYDNLGEFSKALEEFFASLALSKKTGNIRGIAEATNDIGIIEYEQAHYDSSLYYFNYSLILKDSLGEKKSMANTYSNIGLVYHDLGNYPKALEQ